MIDLTAVVYTGSDEQVAKELRRLAELVGVSFRAERGAGILTFEDAGSALSARFHELFSPYFPSGKVELNIADSADILELMAAVGMTNRGIVIGVVGAHGGAGTSTLASWIARQFQNESSCALVDLNPASAGIDQLLAIDAEPGKRWADILGQGTILAGRLTEALPTWHGVHVLSADERGAVPDDASAASALAALSQVHAVTIADLPTTAALRDTILQWCDYLVLVTASDTFALVHAQVRLRSINALVVAMQVNSKSEAAHIADVLNVERVFPVRTVRGLRADMEHGLAPGDRKRSGAARDVAAIVEKIRTEVK